MLSNQPTNGLECDVGFGIAVPNQNPASCNGTYGFYQGGTAQYNFLNSKLGIGTPFPAEMLEVSGNAKIDGNVTASGNGAMPVYNNSGTARPAAHMVIPSAVRDFRFLGGVAASIVLAVMLSISDCFRTASRHCAHVSQAVTQAKRAAEVATDTTL